MPTKSTIVIRPLRASDRTAWNDLWTDYLTFYQTELSRDIYDATFARLLGSDAQDFHGLIAEIDGEPVGLTHFVFHRHCWRIENVCYLQDLFAAPSVRGLGVGRQLIEAVYAAADVEGVSNVYWMTQDDNEAGRRLHDRVGQLTNFIKYQRPA